MIYLIPVYLILRFLIRIILDQNIISLQILTFVNFLTFLKKIGLLIIQTTLFFIVEF